MIVIGIDPGYEQSAFLAWDQHLQTILEAGLLPNDQMLERIRGWRDVQSTGKQALLVIEQIESFGMAVGKTTFGTVRMAGRFEEAYWPHRVEQLPRRIIKVHICGQSRATDSNIRQALIDRFGPSTERAIGTKKAKGPLYGITAHKLAALAVALTWADQNPEAPAGETLRPGIQADF